MNGTAFAAGLSMVIPAVPLIIVSLLVSRFTRIVAPVKLITLGFFIAIAGSLLLSQTLNLESTLWDVIPGMVLITTGIGLLGLIVTNFIMSSAGDKAADASGVVNVAVDLGNSLGTAVIGLILILGVFWGMKTTVEKSFPGKYSAEEITDRLPVCTMIILKFPPYSPTELKEVTIGL